MNKTTAHRLGIEAFKRGARLEPYEDKPMRSIRYLDNPELFGELMNEWRRGWQEEGIRDLKSKEDRLRSSSYCIDRTLSILAHNNGFRNADAMCKFLGASRKTLTTKMASRQAREAEVRPMFESLGLKFTRGQIQQNTREHSYVTGSNGSMTLIDYRSR
jgi:hypothetical protein